MINLIEKHKSLIETGILLGLELVVAVGFYVLFGSRYGLPSLNLPLETIQSIAIATPIALIALLPMALSIKENQR